MRPVLVFALLLVLSACDDGASGPIVDVALVLADGASPLDGPDTLRVWVRQGEGEVQEQTVEVGADGFSLPLAIADLQSPVDLAVEFTGPALRWLGGPPTFAPIEAGQGTSVGLVVVPVGVPRTCAVLEGVSIEQARASAAAALLGTFAGVLGGQHAGGQTAAASYLDLLRFGNDPGVDARLPDLPNPIGAARALAVGGPLALVVSELEPPFVFDITAACADGSADCPVKPSPALHEGAGLGSTLLSLGGGGLVVLGGELSGAGVAALTWIDASGIATVAGLATARRRPAAVELEGGVLVVGGATAVGAPWAEWLPLRRSGQALALSPIAPLREGAMLVADAGRTRALVVGGVDAAGAPISATELIEGCPAACAAVPGPVWTRARAGVEATSRLAGGGLLLGGASPSGLVDEIVFDAEPRIDLHGELVFGRARPSVLALPNGVVFVLGGEAAGGFRADVEICFPSAIAPFATPTG